MFLPLPFLIILLSKFIYSCFDHVIALKNRAMFYKGDVLKITMAILSDCLAFIFIVLKIFDQVFIIFCVAFPVHPS